jgi:hypothetical protein
VGLGAVFVFLYPYRDGSEGMGRFLIVSHIAVLFFLSHYTFPVSEFPYAYLVKIS